ncbi:MAG: sensor histidine kinase, partial [Bacilli bacterium]
DYIYRIYNQSKYMKETIDELLYLSNLEYKQDVNQITELVNLSEIIKEVFEEYHDMASKNNITLFVEAKSGYIYGSEALLKHLVNNLVENAIKYNRENGSVTGKVYEQDNNVIVEVSDTGIGIDNKNIPKLFDRFYRIDASRNRSTGGTGLGLTIVKKICNVHKATIDVNSELGVGTTFKIIFKKMEK